MKEQIRARDHDTCVYCGKSGGALVFDHVFPFAQGGSTTVFNLVLACVGCNAIAGDRVFPELQAKRDWIRWARSQLSSDEITEIIQKTWAQGAGGPLV
jgi:5-methylcytosine-specific restriction endonuclease McrA